MKGFQACVSDVWAGQHALHINEDITLICSTGLERWCDEKTVDRLGLSGRVDGWDGWAGRRVGRTGRCVRDSWAGGGGSAHCVPHLRAGHAHRHPAIPHPHEFTESSVEQLI